MFKQLFLISILILSEKFTFSASTDQVELINSNYLLGQKLFLKGDSTEARKYFERALVANPDHIGSHYAIAKIDFLNKDFVSAFERFRSILSIEKDYKDSEALFKQVLDILRAQYQPDIREPRRLSAQIYLDFKAAKVEYAKDRIDWLTKNHPEFAMGWDHLANYHYRLGDLDTSLQYLKKALSLAPTDPTIFAHYESTYYLKNHEILPEQQRSLLKKKGTTSEAQLDKQIIDQFIADELLKQKQLDEQNIDLDFNTNPNSEGTLATANDNKFFNKLLSQQSQSIPPPPVKKEEPKKQEVIKPTYQPIPQTKNNGEAEKSALISRAENAFRDKNWEVAATSYGILFENNPSENEFQERFEDARAFDQFERKFNKARLLIQRGKRNSDNFAKAFEEFKKLDTRIYYKLYQKSSFDDYLASIAFIQKNYPEAEKLYKSWLRHQPDDLDSFYYLLICLDAQDKYEEALEIYLEAKKINSEDFLKRQGIPKIRLKLYLIKYWWLIIVILVLWGTLTIGYTSIKIFIRKRKADRKSRFQNLRNLASEEKWPELIKRVDELMIEEHTPAEHYNLQYLKANAYLNTSQIEAADSVIKSLLIKYKDDQQATLLQAKIFHSMQNINEEALKSYRLMALKDPGNLDNLKLLLKTLKEQRIFNQETEEVALRILDIESYNKQTLKDLVEIYVNSEKYTPQSCEIMRRYLEIQGSETLVMLHYLKALLSTENYIDAIRTGKKLVNINPDIEEAHRLIIQAYNKLNMNDEMKSYYHQLSLDFSSSKVIQQMYGIVESNYKTSGLDRSQFTTEQEMEITEIAFQEGLALVDKSAFKEAILKFQTASIDSRFTFRSSLLTAKASLLMDDFESACFYFEKLNLQNIKLNNEALEVVYLIAEQYELRGNAQRALQLFQLIAKNDVTFRDTFQKIELISLTSN